LFYLCWDLIVKNGVLDTHARLRCRRSVWSLCRSYSRIRILLHQQFYLLNPKYLLEFFFNFLVRVDELTNSSSNYTISFKTENTFLLMLSTTIGKAFVIGIRKRIKGESSLRLKLIFFWLTLKGQLFFVTCLNKEQRNKKDIKSHLEAMLIKYKGSDLFLF
jgi:hypothetical protein